MGLWVYGCHLQETVIFLVVWEELEASDVHRLWGRLRCGAAGPEGLAEEEGWAQKPGGGRALADWDLQVD